MENTRYKEVLESLKGLSLSFEEIDELENVLGDKRLEVRGAINFRTLVDFRRSVEGLAGECVCETIDPGITDNGFPSLDYGIDDLEVLVLRPKERTSLEALEEEIASLGYRFVTPKEFLSLVAQHGDLLRGHIIALYQGRMTASIYQEDWDYIYLEAEEGKRSLKLTKLDKVPDDFLIAVVRDERE